MERKATITFFILLTTLLIGFVIGFLAHGLFVQRQLRPIAEGRSPERLKEHLSWVMDLDAAQKQKTDSIITHRLDTIGQLMRNHRQAIRAEADMLFDELKPYVRPEQLEKLENSRRRFRRFFMPHFKGEGNRPPMD